MHPAPAAMLNAPVEVTPPSFDRPQLLRLITCGSVDDGKSTLIGRLLYDTKSIFQDQWEAVHRTSLRRGDARVDLALLTDGLRAEREQGITIDVAYRYFSTPRRSFILADTPGHVQYTRNMATGASTADLALILVDARQGVIEQTRRHAYIAALLGVSHLVLCVNKMDLVNFDRGTFDRIITDFHAFSGLTPGAGTRGSGVFARAELTAIPVSALLGDNLVTRSAHTPWFAGEPLLDLLERVQPRPVHEFAHARLPVQWVVRPQDDAHHDYRAACGQIAAGTLRVGDEVVVLPSERRTRIVRLHIGERELQEAVAPLSVSAVLADDVDISRGDMLVHAPMTGSVDAPRPPRITREFDADLVWMSEQPLNTGRNYLIKHTTRTVKAKIAAVHSRLNIHTLAPETGGSVPVSLNDIASVSVRLAAPIMCDAYQDCRPTGAFIVIDDAGNNTLAAGMIR